MHSIHNWHTQYQLWLNHLNSLTFMGAWSKSRARSMILITMRLYLLVIQICQIRRHMRRQLPNSGKGDQVWWIQTFSEPSSWPYLACCAWHINIVYLVHLRFYVILSFLVHEVKEWCRVIFKRVLWKHSKVTSLLHLILKYGHWYISTLFLNSCEGCLFRHINNCRSIAQSKLGHSWLSSFSEGNRRAFHKTGDSWIWWCNFWLV